MRPRESLGLRGRTRARPRSADEEADLRVGPQKLAACPPPPPRLLPTITSATWVQLERAGHRHRRRIRRRPYHTRTLPTCTCPYHPYDNVSNPV